MKKILPYLIYLIIFLLSFFITSKKESLFIFILFIVYILYKYIFKLITPKYNYTNLPSKKNKPYFFLILPTIIAIISFFNNQNDLTTMKNIITSIIYFLSSLIFLYPQNIKYFSKKNHIDNAFSLSCIKTILLPTIDPKDTSKLLRVLHQAKINLIVTKDIKIPKKNKSSFKKIKYQELDLSKKQNIILFDEELGTEQILQITKHKDIYYAKDENLATTIEKIRNSRGLIDNLIKANNLNTILSISLLLSIIFPTILGYPFSFNYLLVLSLLFIKDIFINCFAPYFRFDTDLMEREPRDSENPLILKQDKLFLSISILLVNFATSIPFMASLASGSSVSLATTLSLISYLFCFIILAFQNVTERITIINFLTIYQDKRMLISTLIIILSMVTLSYLPFVSTKPTIPSNYLHCLLIAFVILVGQDLIKLARFTTIRKKDKK